MLKIYFKQAIELIKQNKLFSWIYIFGTALAIATTTIMAVLINVKVSPFYPEYNRSNIYYLENLTFTDGNRTSSGGGLSELALKEWIYPLKNVEVISVESCNSIKSYMGYELSTIDDKVNITAMGKSTDTEFFKLYSYEFIEGKPFTQSDIDVLSNVVAVSDNTAEQLFGTVTGAEGKKLWIDNVEYKICGVYVEPSKIMTESYAQIIIPYKSSAAYLYRNSQSSYEGSFKVRFLCKDATQGEALKTELKEVERKFNSSVKEGNYKVDFSHYPISCVEKVVGGGNRPFSWGEFTIAFGSIFFILLLIPALNLSGMISGRMDMRSMELGVRKSFGATRRSLLNQVLWENFVLTVIGGVVGFVITCVLLYLCRSWIFSLLDFGGGAVGDVNIAAEMLFSPVIFLFSFLVCIILNFMSALIPAWNSLRKPIVDSLNV